MPNRWVEVPRVFPFRCDVDGNSGPEAGPYWETDFEYHNPRIGSAAGLKPGRLYLSFRLLRTIYESPGSPFLEGLEDLVGGLRAEHAAVLDENAALRRRVSELEAMLADGVRASADEIADRVAQQLLAAGAEEADQPQRRTRRGAR
jgi:hypothetical protein